MQITSDHSLIEDIEAFGPFQGTPVLYSAILAVGECHFHFPHLCTGAAAEWDDPKPKHPKRPSHFGTRGRTFVQTWSGRYQGNAAAVLVRSVTGCRCQQPWRVPF